jgi:xylulokinase
MVKFLPYLSGERTPHNDAAVRGAFTGLSRDTSTADLTQAVLEGVAFALRDNRAALFGDGAVPERLTAVGGGAKSQYWVELIATVLGIPVAVPVDGDHGAALGAARLGLIASTNADPTAVCIAPEIADRFDPRTDLAPAFSEAYANWRQLYPSIVEH